MRAVLVRLVALRETLHEVAAGPIFGGRAEVIAELLASRESERSGRLVDSDQVASMERKKAEGYF